MREVNVAIADDNERILDMLGEIIEQDQDLNLIGKADNGKISTSDQRKETGCCITGSDHAKDGWIKCDGKSKYG